MLLRVCGNLHAAAGTDGDNLAAAGNHGRIRNRRLAGAVNHRRTYKREGSGAAAWERCAHLRQRGHLIMRGAGDKRRERGFIIVANGLEVIELGVGRDQRSQIIGAVHPQHFHAPDEPLTV